MVNRGFMPLKAIVNGKTLLAPSIGLDDWRALQKEKPNVLMTCCAAKGYMRVREGMQEFVHKQRPEDCLGRPDSIEHDYLKTAVMHAAEDAGWVADVESRDPKGKWVADVLAIKGGAKVIFEVQLSPITYEELRGRYAAYRQSKIRSCWFVKGRLGRARVEEPGSNIPIFSLEQNDEREFGEPRFQISLTANCRMSVKAAVSALLNREFKWCDKRRARKIETLSLLNVRNCPHCRKSFGMYMVNGVEIECGESTRHTYTEDRRFMDADVFEAVESYVNTHPELSVPISEPRQLAHPITRYYDIVFTCGRCNGFIFLHHDIWRWHERIADITLIHSDRYWHSPHWCHSKKMDFCC
jgi:hypothetical protein